MIAAMTHKMVTNRFILNKILANISHFSKKQVETLSRNKKNITFANCKHM